MNDTVATSPVASALAPLRAWWRGLASRERRLVGLAAAVLLGGLLWAVAVAPAWRTLARAPAELDALDAQLQTMQRQAAEAEQLRAAPPVNLELATSALKAATERLGDKGRLVVQGERAVLTLTGVRTGQLRDWLAEARSGARARPLEASLQVSAAGHSGTVVVAIGGSGP